MAKRTKQRFQKLKRILIVGDPRSPLTRERGLVGHMTGNEVYWYSSFKAEFDGLTVSVPPLPNFCNRVSFLYSPFFLDRFINRIQPDLIHVYYAYQQADTFVLERFKPLLITVMGGDILTEQSFNGMRAWLIKRMLDNADIITSKTFFLDTALNRIGNYSSKIRRVTWGVDTKKFYPGLNISFLRNRWNIQPEDMVFFCPRICQPFYNNHLILQAFSYYLQGAGKELKSKLLITELFSEKSYSQKLRGLVTELGLTGKVYFVGTIPHQEMPAYFNLADIMVSTPPSDGMPQSLYEAMACGSYPILGNLPQYQEIIQDGVNGRLVPVGDVFALSEAMSWVATHDQHRKTTTAFNRKLILEMADKDKQDQLINSIYDELFQKYSKMPRHKPE
jgi:glycosyltransferase involved in cell wall biosynthesis